LAALSDFRYYSGSFLPDLTMPIPLSERTPKLQFVCFRQVINKQRRTDDKSRADYRARALTL